VIARAVASDPEAARAEWEGEFRTDISAFLDEATIESAIDFARPSELPPLPKTRYSAFVDASGGRGDAYTIAIAHKESDRVIIDAIRGRHPPFDPQSVTAEFAALAKQYRVTKVTGDNYSADWVTTAFKDCSVRYQRSERPKSQLYLECLPLFTRGLITIPDHARLTRELRLLERRTHRSGKIPLITGVTAPTTTPTLFAARRSTSRNAANTTPASTGCWAPTSRPLLPAWSATTNTSAASAPPMCCPAAAPVPGGVTEGAEHGPRHHC
jgi:hypothetical protein